MVQDHKGEHSSLHAAIQSIAAKIGCSGETLRNWIRQAESDKGVRVGPMTDERERIKALEREVRELRQANGILRKASRCCSWSTMATVPEFGCGRPGEDAPECTIVDMIDGWPSAAEQAGRRT